jgi:hypothetical protein
MAKTSAPRRTLSRADRGWRIANLTNDHRHHPGDPLPFLSEVLDAPHREIHSSVSAISGPIAAASAPVSYSYRIGTRIGSADGLPMVMVGIAYSASRHLPAAQGPNCFTRPRTPSPSG